MAVFLGQMKLCKDIVFCQTFAWVIDHFMQFGIN